MNIRTVPVTIIKDGKKKVIGSAEIDPESSQMLIEFDPEYCEKFYTSTVNDISVTPVYRKGNK